MDVNGRDENRKQYWMALNDDNLGKKHTNKKWNLFDLFCCVVDNNNKRGGSNFSSMNEKGWWKGLACREQLTGTVCFDLSSLAGGHSKEFPHPWNEFFFCFFFFQLQQKSKKSKPQSWTQKMNNLKLNSFFFFLITENGHHLIAREKKKIAKTKFHFTFIKKCE